MVNILLISIAIPIFMENIDFLCRQIYMNNLFVEIFLSRFEFKMKNIMIIKYSQIVDSLKFTY